MKVHKSVTQVINSNQDLEYLTGVFSEMLTKSIRLGVKNNITTLKRLSLMAYHEIDTRGLNTSYKLNAISQACGILSRYKKELKKNPKAAYPRITSPYVTNCYGFKINGCLLSIPFRPKEHINILLNEHTIRMISGNKVKSFTISRNRLSLCIQKEVEMFTPQAVLGIDRNLRNVTVGNKDMVTFYKTNKLLPMKENTIYARAGFKRNDRRVKLKFWERMNGRLVKRRQQLMHRISKGIVEQARESQSIIVLENLKGIRKMYKKGNGQGNKYRRKLNGWPFYELQRQIQYKAAWEGVPVDFIDPKRTSKLCPICGDRIQEDKYQHRKLWCNNCKKPMNRDVVASLNISYKGWARFIHPRGDTVEAQSCTFEQAMAEPRLSKFDDLPIRIVDVSKSTLIR